MNIFNGKGMAKLRSFIYLDNYKMYSFSSQLFEGLTEYIVKSDSEKVQEAEQQKGKLGSGRILADIIEKDISQTEKKFLHDYSYNLFEESLIKSNRVLELNKSNIASSINLLPEYSFVKVSGRVAFNDLNFIQNTIENYNSIGEALAYITHKPSLDSAKAVLEEQAKSITDRNSKAKAKGLINNATNIKRIAKEKGLHFDPEYLKSLSFILDYGYHKQFEAQMPITDANHTFHLFSAQLIRENLKDSEYNIIKKYSRESEKEFKLFGIPTQVQNSDHKESLLEKITKKVESPDTDNNMKEALMNFVALLTNVEKTFTGKLDYEYVIDPIALYIEV